MKSPWFAVAVLAGSLTPVRGADAPVAPAPTDQPVKEEPKPAPEPEKKEPREEPNKGTQKQVDKLTAEFGVTEKEVTDLRASGLGWGEIRHALSISQRAKVPVSEVMKLRDSGMGWGMIAQHYGFKLGGGRHEAKDGDRDDKRDAVGERRERAAERREHGRDIDRGRGMNRSGERRGPPAWSHGGGPRR